MSNEHQMSLPMSEIHNGSKDFGNVTDFQQIGWSMGTNPGGVFREPVNGTEFYIKRYTDPRQSSCEFVANRIYAAGGTPVLRGYLLRDGQSIAYATPYRKDIHKLPGNKRHLAQQFFALSCYLLDWDAVGTGPENPYGNLQEDEKGNLVLVDHGGSLLFRGLNGLKRSDSLVFDVVPELETMRSNINPRSQAIFQSIEEKEIDRQIKELTQKITEPLINAVVEESQLGQEKGLVRELLISRRNALVHKY